MPLRFSFARMLLLFGFLLTWRCSNAENLPLPRLVIVGQTGSGKSTLANVLLGQSPDCDNCTFAICNGHDSCTKETSYAVGNWLGEGETFTVVDTPGFGDSDNEDTELIDEMMEVLHNVVKGANAVMLLVDGTEERFDAALQQMIREMQALFGEALWANTIVGVSHWAYDANSVNQRNYTGKTEEVFMAEWNELLQTKFHIDTTLSGVFIDSWSQQPWNLGDPLQQEAFRRETEKLWKFFENHEEFPFRTIEDVLEENEAYKEENRWLNDVIVNNISQLTLMIQDNKDTIGILSQEVTNNGAHISENRLRIAENRANIESNSEDILDLLPVGSVVAWLGADSESSILPAGWQRCDGSLILSGPMVETRTPNLNGEAGHFLRGGTFGQAGSTHEDQMRSHSHSASAHVTDPGHSHQDTGHSHGYVDKWRSGGEGDNAHDRHMSDLSTENRKYVTIGKIFENPKTLHPLHFYRVFCKQDRHYKSLPIITNPPITIDC